MQIGLVVVVVFHCGGISTDEQQQEEIMYE